MATHAEVMQAQERSEQEYRKSVFQAALDQINPEETSHYSAAEMNKFIANRVESVEHELKQKLDQSYVASFTDGKNVSVTSNLNNGAMIKDNGDSYLIHSDINFQGTGEEFARDPSKTQIYLRDPSQGGIKHIIQKITLDNVQNTHPYPVCLSLMGAPRSNLHVAGSNTASQTHSICNIPAYARSPITVNRVIYDANTSQRGQGLPQFDAFDFKYHDVTPQQIANSFNVPEYIKDSIPKLRSMNLAIINTDSPLNHFINDNMETPQLFVNEHIFDLDPDIAIHNLDMVNSAHEQLKKFVAESPFGRIENIKSSISRLNNEAWDEPQAGLDEFEMDDVLHTPQHVSASITIHCVAANLN